MNEHSLSELSERLTYLFVIGFQFLDTNYQGMGVLIAAFTGAGTLYFKYKTYQLEKRKYDD